MNLGRKIDNFFNKHFGKGARDSKLIKKAIYGRSELEDDTQNIQRWYDMPFFRLCDLIQPFLVIPADNFDSAEAYQTFENGTELLRAMIESGAPMNMNEIYRFSWHTGNIFKEGPVV